MAAVFTVLLVLSVSVLVVRIASVGLTLTGISKDLAEFQSLSAFTGSGFTTEESEEIVNHPVRRRIVMHLMLLGHAGMFIGVPSVLLSFLSVVDDGHLWNERWFRLGALVVGVALMWFVTTTKVVDTAMWKMNEWALRRWSRLEVQDYHRLLRFAHEYVVWEMKIQYDDWLAGKTLVRSKLASEGVLVLGIERADGSYVGAPRGETRVAVGDSLIVYGRQKNLEELDVRRDNLDGNVSHMLAVTRQQVARERDETLG